MGQGTWNTHFLTRLRLDAFRSPRLFLTSHAPASPTSSPRSMHLPALVRNWPTRRWDTSSASTSPPVSCCRELGRRGGLFRAVQEIAACPPSGPSLGLLSPPPPTFSVCKRTNVGSIIVTTKHRTVSGGDDIAPTGDVCRGSTPFLSPWTLRNIERSGSAFCNEIGEGQQVRTGAPEGRGRPSSCPACEGCLGQSRQMQGEEGGLSWNVPYFSLKRMEK